MAATALPDREAQDGDQNPLCPQQALTPTQDTWPVLSCCTLGLDPSQKLCVELKSESSRREEGPSTGG